MAVFTSRVVLAICAALLVLATGVADASTILFRTDAELIALSDRVVHGRVVRQRVERPDGPDGAIYTVSTLAVLEDFTGVAGPEVEVWELGGTMGNETMWVGGGVTYDVGSTVLVCLERGRLGFRSVAMGFSRFAVEPTATADGSFDGRLTRQLADVTIVGGPAGRRSELSLAEFRDLASRVRGVTPRRNPEAQFAASEPEVTSGFTFLGPFRWTEADTGTAVNWYLNTSAPSPLTAGDGTAELQLALQAWTAPTSATILLHFAGTTNQSAAKGPWTGISSSGTGVVTFEDPNNEISGSVLAIGGGFAFSTGGGTVNGQAFGKFTRGYVIFQNAVDLSSSFRQSTNFARVLEHEIGHTIGLGHSEMGTANIMHPSCCSTSTPTAPGLGPDDLAGVNFIYPSSTSLPPPPSTCSYSISPTAFDAPAAGTTGSISVTAGTGCPWSAAVTTGASFLSLVGGITGSGSGTVVYTVVANSTTAARTATLTVAGQNFTLTQSGGPCAFTLSAASATSGVAGGASTVIVSTPANCAWTASAADPFLTVNSGSSVTGSGTVGYTVAPNSTPSFRVGSITIAGQAFVVTQFGSGPAMSLDKPALSFGGVTNNGSLVAQTTSQAVRLTQTGTGLVGWTAVSNVAWLSVSPAAGTGTATLNVSVINTGALPGAGTINGAITFTFGGAGSPSGPITASLSLYQPAVPAPATGVVDTPANNATGVAGSIPVTGWAVDDIEVTRVRILRDPIAGEGPDQIFIGTATFVDGSRPDVAALFPSVPRRTRAGWGYLLLTNTLPNLGDGTFRLHAYADDADGHTTLLGSRTIVCANSISTAPFGAIDSPEQGAVVSGVISNFGWVLARGPSLAYPPNGTVTVIIDGVAAGSPTGWTSRPDLTAIFPAATYPGVTNALGVATIDTTRLTNGVHTLAWVVTASDGQAAGIGSRYFIVQNAIAPATDVPDESPLVSRAGPEVTIDLPAGASAVGTGEPLRIAGWAIDRGADNGTGVGTIHVWAYPSGNGQPLFLGAARYGLPREDVGRVFGSRFTASGYDLVVEGLPPGTYDIAVFAWGTATQSFAPARTVRVVIR